MLEGNLNRFGFENAQFQHYSIQDGKLLGSVVKHMAARVALTCKTQLE